MCSIVTSADMQEARTLGKQIADELNEALDRYRQNDDPRDPSHAPRIITPPHPSCPLFTAQMKEWCGKGGGGFNLMKAIHESGQLHGDKQRYSFRVGPFSGSVFFDVAVSGILNGKQLNKAVRVCGLPGLTIALNFEFSDTFDTEDAYIVEEMLQQQSQANIEDEPQQEMQVDIKEE